MQAGLAISLSSFSCGSSMVIELNWLIIECTSIFQKETKWSTQKRALESIARTIDKLNSDPQSCPAHIKGR